MASSDPTGVLNNLNDDKDAAKADMNQPSQQKPTTNQTPQTGLAGMAQKSQDNPQTKQETPEKEVDNNLSGLPSSNQIQQQASEVSKTKVQEKIEKEVTEELEPTLPKSENTVTETESQTQIIVDEEEDTETEESEVPMDKFIFILFILIVAAVVIGAIIAIVATMM